MGAREKVIGVLGGMGPRATVSFFESLTLLTPASKDWEHLRVIIDSNTKIPSRTRAALYGETSPVKEMVNSINGLARMGADFVVVPCNSAHYWYNEVSAQVDIPWLNMLQVVANAAKTIMPILVVGGYIPSHFRLYDKYLPRIVYPPQDVQASISDLIEQRKLDMEVPIIPSISWLAENYPDYCLLLACTELTLGPRGALPNCLDSAVIYAKATIDYACK